MSRLDWAEPRREPHSSWLDRYRRLLEIRKSEIMPRLAGMPPFAGGYEVLGPKAVGVKWQLGDRSRLRLLANFDEASVHVAPAAADERVLYSSAEPGAPHSATFFLLPSAAVR
jgi:maltooligosyltrehalose trehalohydrolase